jgi:Fic family protein
VFADKYKMTRAENLTLAKRNVVDSIWKEARLEGIAVTFPDPQTIYEGRTVAGLTLDQTKAINNLKNAWAFVFESLDAEVDILYLRQLNSIIGADGLYSYAGELRLTAVAIGGTKWQPELPSFDAVQATLGAIAQIQDPVDRALETFAAVCRGQWFIDGNKRTAQLAANQILIGAGCGVLAIDVGDINAFYSLLIPYYETGDSSALKLFLYSNALEGADFSAQRAAHNKD